MNTPAPLFAWMVAPWSAYGWGQIAVFSDGKSVTGLSMMAGDMQPPAGAVPQPGHPLLAETLRQLAAFFSGRLRNFDLPLAPAGTEFQRRVWDELRRIPAGETRSYGEVALAVGRPRAARAVGGACGANPIPVIIPCHRVLTAGMHIGGFSDHSVRAFKLKCFFLQLEQAARPPECAQYARLG